MAKKEKPDASGEQERNEQRKFSREQKSSNNDQRAFAEEYAKLIREQNQELGTQKAIQSEITSRLQELRKNTTGHNIEIGASISLSKSITKSLEDSISAGKSINQIENSKNKIKTQGSLIDLQMGALAKDSGSTVDELLGKAQQRTNLQKELASEAAIYKGHLEEVKSVEEQILQSSQNTEQSKRNIFYLEGEIEGLSGKELEAKQKILGEEVKKLKTLEQIDISNLKDLNTSISKQKLAETDLKTAEEKFKNLEEQLTVEEKQAIELVKSRDTLKEADLSLQKQLDKQNAINSALGLSGQGIAAFNKLLGGALGSTSEIESESRRIVEQKIEEETLQNKINGKLDEAGNVIEGNVSKMQGFGIQLGQIGKSIGKNMMDPLVLIGAALEFSDQTTSLQKDLAISRGEANDMVFDFQLMATAGGDLAITGTRIQASFSTLADQIGTTSKSLMGMSADAAVLSEKLGVSADGVGNAGKASLMMGKSIKDIKLDIIDSTTKIRTQTGIALNYKDILKATLNVSGQIRAQLGGNPKLIAKAVAQAKALGMELEQVAKIGNSLLDFESSIGAELEAELLTGKQLNLEKARLLALTGDYEGLSKEIASQAGTFTDYSKMNVIQQNQLAKAFGMSADEMADMLMDQESLGKTAEQLRAEGKEELAQRMEARSLQEKFNDAVMQLKEIFVKIAGGPLMELLEGLSEGAEGAFKMLEPIITVAVMLAKWVTSIINFASELGILTPIVAIIAGMWALGKMTTWFTMAKAGFSGMKDTIKGTIGGIKSLVDGIKNFGKGASNIKFDPRMAGGGRFKDVGTGKMVSNKAAKAAGAKKTDLFKGVKPKDISKDATAATKGGAATGKSSKGMSSGLKELASGLKAMGAGKVLQGIVNMALAGPAFVLALPSIPFLLFIGLTPLKQLGSNMRALASGLKAMGGGKQLFGVGVVAALGLAGAIALAAIPFLGFIGLFGTGVAAGLVALGTGLTTLGGVAASGVPFIAVALIAALGVALIPFGVALMAAGKGMEYFGKGIKSALEPIPPIINALANAMVKVLGALGDFVMQISKLPISKLLIMGPALMVMGAGFAALGVGLLIASPGLTVLALVGLPALMALGELAPALNSVIFTMATAFETMAGAAGDFFTDIGALDPGQLIMLGPAFLSIGAGLVGLGMGALVAAPGLWILGKRMHIFKKLAKVADPLKTVADAIKSLSSSISKVKSVGYALKELAKSLSSLGGAAVLGAIFIPPLAAALGLLAPVLKAVAEASIILGKGIKLALEPIPPIMDAITASMGTFFDTLGEINPMHILTLGPAFASMSIGLTALGIGALIAAPGLYLLEKRMPVFKTMGDLAPNLKAASSAVDSLSKNVSNMKAIGTGFKHMGSGLKSLAFGLLMIAPFLPVLESVSKMTHTLGSGDDKEKGGPGEMGSTGNQTVKLDDGTIKKMASMVAQAVSKVKVNGDVSTDLWGQGNRNGEGSYAGKVKNSTSLS